ncbi:MAG: 16S rRNA (cytosine(967)-C(5))-methyltransferase RsmB [Clostridia bacterium]|nr:16S rRNA (cytosine(967)-C(5))-methyltransferase RsmB [Clostridia bacterium]
MPTASRELAYTALMRVEQDGSYSNIALDRLLSESSLSGRDKGFCSKLFYGVLENRLLLDYNIAVRSKIPAGEIETGTMVLLRMGLYQLFFADSVSSAAAVNETVELCREKGFGRAAGFVNGVLRSAARDRLLLPDPKKGKNKYLSIKYSCPEKIIKLWRQSYGDDLTLASLEALQGRPPLCIRVNTLKTTAQELKSSLESMGIGAEYSRSVENCLLLTGAGAIEELEQYRQGLFHVQDTASQLCSRTLSPVKGCTMLDVCAAPGGKTFTCAELMENKGKIIACDKYDSRLRLVRSGAGRLGINIIETMAGDAAASEFVQADRVLCDVPCSGLGIIRRKPELRYKPDLGLSELPQIQYEILCNASRFVKSGGYLLYSTCTLDPDENNLNAQRFIKEHRDFSPASISLPEGIERKYTEEENELTLFPEKNGTDGFFISLFRRK